MYLVTVLVALTKYLTRSSLREEVFILAYHWQGSFSHGEEGLTAGGQSVAVRSGVLLLSQYTGNRQ